MPPQPTSTTIPTGAIDTHAHVFEPGLPMLATRRYTPRYSATLANYLSLLDTHGLAGGVLIQPSFLGYDNHYLLDSLHRARGRCRGVVCLDPATPPAALRAMDAAGVAGMRLNLFGCEVPPLRDANWRALFSELNDLDWHVEVHCPASMLPRAMAPLLEYGCKLVIDHFGRPDGRPATDWEAMDYLCNSADSGRVWVKLSAAYRIWQAEGAAHSALSATQLLHAFSAQRLLWGSDWPHTEHELVGDVGLSLQYLSDWVPDVSERATILSDTPRLLFKFQGDIPCSHALAP
ncbi:amidohydrolase family protein [Candidimonas humi]|uniref:Amidohydrolase family protein n=1 Tax=Candidimonas humi TaxID=683355 RepID=A0ABV8NYJ6_9BURK|nr:amidohydrolase family protein [Candidimonas humi]MBV6305513.1 amidohydrolase family protein [Candidimonas humi]